MHSTVSPMGTCISLAKFPVARMLVLLQCQKSVSPKKIEYRLKFAIETDFLICDAMCWVLIFFFHFIQSVKISAAETRKIVVFLDEQLDRTAA